MDWNIVLAAIVALLVGILGGVVAHILGAGQRINQGTRNTLIVLSVLAAAAILISGVISSQQKSAPKVPAFSGKVGHFEDSTALWEFVTSHQGKPIYLEISMEYGMAEASFDPVMPSFILWVDCPLLQPGEEPSTSACAEGQMYSFSEPPGSKYIFEPYRGVNRVKGYFIVEDMSGPFQGIFAIRLRPVSAEEVLFE